MLAERELLGAHPVQAALQRRRGVLAGEVADLAALVVGEERDARHAGGVGRARLQRQRAGEDGAVGRRVDGDVRRLEVTARLARRQRVAASRERLQGAEQRLVLAVDAHRAVRPEHRVGLVGVVEREEQRLGDVGVLAHAVEGLGGELGLVGFGHARRLLAGPLADLARPGVGRPAHLGQPDLLGAVAVRVHHVVDRAVAEERPLADGAARRVAEVAVRRADRAPGVGVRRDGVEGARPAVVVDALHELVVVARQAAQDDRRARVRRLDGLVGRLEEGHVLRGVAVGMVLVEGRHPGPPLGRVLLVPDLPPRDLALEVGGGLRDEGGVLGDRGRRRRRVGGIAGDDEHRLDADGGQLGDRTVELARRVRREHEEPGGLGARVLDVLQVRCGERQREVHAGLGGGVRRGGREQGERGQREQEAESGPT